MDTTTLIFCLSVLVFAVVLLFILVTELIIKKNQLKSKDLEHLRILKGHLDLYKDCLELGDITSLKTFLHATSTAVDNSVIALSESLK